MTSTTLDQQPRTSRDRRPIAWSWLAFSVFSVALAILLGIVTSGECYRDDCSVAFAGGPIGWFAIAALLSQATWAGIRAFRPEAR